MAIIDKRKEKKLKACEKVIDRWWKDRLAVGRELRKIRDGKLYEVGWGTFEEYVKARFGWTRDNAYKLISASNVVKSLNTGVENGIQNERQARALKAVPEEKRAEVVERAKAGGKVTAARITEEAKRESPPIHTDAEGNKIPDEILSDWQRAEAFSIYELKRIRRELEDGIGEDVIFAEITNTTTGQLKQVCVSLERIAPHVVCPYCQGLTRDKCTLCRKRGWISEFLFKNAIPKKKHA